MMNKKIVIVSLVMLIVVVLGISAVSAQGNGNGPVPGDGTPLCADGDMECQVFNYGGVGFVNGQTGARWNDQERGNMRNSNGSGTAGTGFYATLPPVTDAELSEAEIAAMTDGWLDEQHAYAVYGAVIDQFGAVAPFVSIQRSEAQHIAAWELIFDRYGVPVPAVPEFDLPTFATLSDACQTAAAAEIANFGLYNSMLTTLSDYPDMVQVITVLRNASEYNHLPAFENCAS